MPLSGLRILVVEDEYLIALDTEHLLLEAGAHSVSVTTRAQFEKAISGASFDALLVDTGPDRSYIDADIALAEKIGARIAFTTSDAELSSGMDGYEGVPFIAKPYDGRQISALISAIRGAKAEDQS